MKDAYDVLKEKEADLARVRHEIESLRIVALLLLDDLNPDQSDKTNLISAEKTDEHLNDDLLNIARQKQDLAAAGTDGLFSSITTSNAALWKMLKHAK